MTQSFVFPLLAAVLLYFASYNRDSYQLDWSHTEVQSQSRIAAPPVPVPKSKLPELKPPPPAKVTPLPRPGIPPTYQLPISVRHFFSHEKNRYVQVDHIQTTIYRKRSYNTETHWNVAGNSQMDLVLSRLSPGDRYQLEIIWDDGSRRWIDQVVGRKPPGRLYVDEPDAFERK